MEPLPSDRKRVWQIAGVVAAGGLATALIVGGLWLAYRPDPLPPTQAGIEPAEETSSTSMTPAPSHPTSDATPAAPTPGTADTGTKRAPRLAFRLGGTLYIADESGTAPKKVVASAGGPYALSPDAATLAVVDGGTLKLVDVTSGKAASAGPAEAATPVWVPDSSAVMYVRLGGTSMEVWRTKADGSDARKLTDGSSVAVSPDGSVVVVRRDASGGSLGAGAVYVSRGGGPFAAVTVKGQPTSAAVTNDRLIVGLVDTAGTASLVASGVDGRGAKRLLGAPGGTTPSVWGELQIAPDGSKVAAVAVGDDGYSRISVVTLDGGSETRLSRRRDGYPRGWDAAGAQLFVLEGNYFQGEPTTLVRLLPDGTKRTPLVTGAE